MYIGTLEEAALDLIGAKMLAATVFYGDEASGALIDEENDGQANLLNDLVRRAMGELQVGRAEGIFSINGESDMAEASVESVPPITNLPATTLVDLWERRREIRRAAKSRRKQSADEPVNQMTLF